jgi:transaldolase/glucose-6-phosphate isomerase
MAIPPVEVQSFGQSIWYDNIQRSLITGGELQRMIDQDGILGVTSNPTIFQKAIGSSADYDPAIMTMLDLSPYDIYERLATEDIQNALDLFRPVYERTNARDGYVSLEVSPLIANDTQSTVEEAKRLFASVNRPNAMIKIPATEAGIPAIEEAIAAGININVTLIFSVKNYEQVVMAFIRGLERRLAAGQSVARIASVASFFLSRIDTVVDRMLDNNIRAAQGRDLARVALNNKLKGKTAIANAKVAYKHFQSVFYGERFAALRDAGAQVQRLLWASTGVKNPAYPDTMYVENLIGRDTVNTMPPDALKAFIDHGKVAETLTQDVDDAEQTLDLLAEAGIDLDQITHQLQVDGVEAFSESFRSLLAQVEARRDVLKTGVMRRQEVALGIHTDAVKAALKDADAKFVNVRLWNKEASLWHTNPNIMSRIVERLGWLDTDKTIDYARLAALRDAAAAEFAAGTLRHVVLLGMGGSSLAPEVMNKSLSKADGFPNMLMLDSTDPTYIRYIESQVDLSRTLFIVSSKSGGTIETSCFFEYFYERTGRKGAQFIAITDAGSSLEATARERHFRDIFLNPADIGGRYSALSYFGLVPAALIGIDLERLKASADAMMLACGSNIAAAEHPGIWLGAIMGVIGKAGQDKVTLICSPSIESFGDWAEQLIAESTGKDGRGLLPVVGATVGKPHDYATDRLFIYLRVDGDANDDLDAGVRILQEAGHPVVKLHLPDAYAIGGEFFRWEYATAIAGMLLGINPFDEPNVTESKQNTGRLLDHFKTYGSLPANQPTLVEDGTALFLDPKTDELVRRLAAQHNLAADTISGAITALLNASQAGDYVAILAYLPMLPEIDETLEDLRRRARHAMRRAVTLGYGPRFLHSTGQLHKGGGDNGIFIQITCDDSAHDLPIPGAVYTFGVLKAAQAAGDMESLTSRGRRALRLHLTGDSPADLTAKLAPLAQALDELASRRH